MATAQQREAAARYSGFGEFYEDTSARMLARAVLTCLHRQDAEDAVADAYLKALRHWERIGGYSPPEAEQWVRTTLRRDLLKTLQSRKKDDLLEVPVPPQSSVEETVEARRVLGAVACLPPRQRAALVAHCLEGLPQEDVAQEMGVKRGAVAAHIYQARRTLERLLGLTPPSLRPGPAEQLTWVPQQTSASMPPHSADPAAALLLGIEAWLWEGIETDGRALERVRTAITSRLPGTGQEEPW